MKVKHYKESFKVANAEQVLEIYNETPEASLSVIVILAMLAIFCSTPSVLLIVLCFMEFHITLLEILFIVLSLSFIWIAIGSLISQCIKCCINYTRRKVFVCECNFSLRYDSEVLYLTCIDRSDGNRLGDIKIKKSSSYDESGTIGWIDGGDAVILRRDV